MHDNSLVVIIGMLSQARAPVTAPLTKRALSRAPSDKRKKLPVDDGSGLIAGDDDCDDDEFDDRSNHVGDNNPRPGSWVHAESDLLDSFNVDFVMGSGRKIG